MRIARRISPALLLVMFALLLASMSQVMFAKVLTAAHPEARVTQKVDNAQRAILYGHVPSAVRTATDLGRLPANTPMKHLIMVLQADTEQEHELRIVIDQQHDKKAGNFHQWLKPEEFGEHFGVHDSDIEQVKNWLTSQGLSVELVSKGKRYIQFSGASAQVEKAFNIEMHYYKTRSGEMHVSLDREVSVPEALSTVVRSVPTLHDFFKKSYMENARTLKPNHMIRSKIKPDLTNGTTHFVGANDFATIYNTTPLLNAGINGQGVTIAIIARTDILLADVQAYKQLFNLPNNDPNFIVTGEDPGYVSGDDGESDLDVEVSGGIAPQATIDFVTSRATLTVDGVDLSAAYAVENNLADIISESYGQCEADLVANSFYNILWEQAAAQGISVFVSTGDNGPAGCDTDTDAFEVFGYAVSGLASTPFNVAVGGTQFNDTASPSTWWTTGNNANLGSALSYIPELPWDQSKAAGVSNGGLGSGSSGISSYYQTPAWQRGPGVPLSDPALTQGGNWVTAVNITNGGSGYTSAPTVGFSGGGCAQLPVAAANISGGAVVSTSFQYGLANPEGQGIGCTSAPTVAFTGGGGTGATANTTIGQMQDPVPVVPGPHRYMPDVSLNASSAHDPTVFCSEGGCQINSAGAWQSVGLVGGTSVAAPSMAGIQALVNQYNGGRQGMPGYYYYGLAAAQTTASCASQASPLPAAACVFNDTITGNNFVCGTSTCSTSTGTKIGFTSITGYDLATGLGSVNSYNLATKWNTIAFSSSATTLNLGQTTGINHGSGVSVTVNVTGLSGTPTGDVAFIASAGTLGNVIDTNSGQWVNLPAFGTLSGGTYSGTLSDLPAGTYNVIARYAGDATFGSSTSAPIQVTVNAENSAVTIASNAFDGTNCIESASTSFAYGDYIWIDATVRGISGQGLPTGTVVISDNATPIATSTLNANGVAHMLAGPVPTSSCVNGYTFQDVATFGGGTHNLTATYSGDSTFNASSTSGPLAVTVSAKTITPTLAAGATLITSGFADQLTATFASTSGANSLTASPTGSVTFTDTTTATVLGTSSIVPNSTAGGTATLSTTGITTAGANSITASYGGDSNYAAASSTPVSVTVGTGTATTTTVTLSSGANPTTLNGRPTFTATVAGGAGPTAGTVTFYDGTSVLITGTVGAGHTATGRVPSSSQVFAAGTHNITATFGGNSTFMASTSSPAFAEGVSKSNPTFAANGGLTVKSLGSTGQNFAFSCVLSAAVANYPYLAGVQFFDGGNPIGSTQPFLAVGGKEAQYVTTLSAGTHNITCSYAGDSNYNASGTSNTQVVTVGTTSTGIYSPAAGSTLAGSAATFKWYSGATSYWVDIGKEVGGNEYYQSGIMSNLVLSASVNSLPTDGSTVYVRWYYLVNSVWQHVDYSYTAVGGSSSKGVITAPTPPGPLSGASQTFTWSAGSGATAYWIDAGSTAGGNQYFQSGNIGNVFTENVTGLPTNGSTVYVTLYSLVSGSWLSNAYTYTAFNAAGASGMMQTPTTGSTFTGSSVTFTWSAGAGASAYWLDVGSNAGGNQYYQSGNLGGALTTTVNGLPTDSSTVYVTLYSLIGGTWQGNAYTYTAFNGTGAPATIQTPAPLSTLSGNSATFTWNADASATAYWLDIGNVAGGNQYYQSGNLGNVLTTTVNSLPADGSTIYATLYSYVGGQWQNTMTTFVSGP